MLSNAVNEVVNEFESNPARFTVESDVAAQLKHLVNGDMDLIRARGTHDSGGARGVKDHSVYADKICRPTKIDAAHCEVNIRELQAPDTVRLIDLAVFQDDVQFELVDGTKRFPADSVAAATEVKYVKNKKYLRPDSRKFEQIEKDIYRLDQLPNADELYALVLGNFNLSRRRDGKEAFDDLGTISADVEVIHVYPGGVFRPAQQ